jgi:hypothetical protein
MRFAGAESNSVESYRGPIPDKSPPCPRDTDAMVVDLEGQLGVDINCGKRKLTSASLLSHKPGAADSTTSSSQRGKRSLPLSNAVSAFMIDLPP